jgi:hypothetical protein
MYSADSNLQQRVLDELTWDPAVDAVLGAREVQNHLVVTS